MNNVETIPANHIQFHQQYIALRTKEQRVYNDKIVAKLPAIDTSHIHYKEWQVRKHSAEKLFYYLAKKKTPLNILEIGCGNGWLSALLADLPNASATGIDINETELKQASTVFSEKKNLHFQFADVMKGDMDEKRFDVIVFAASIHYFPSLPGIITKTGSLLKESGEIHIIDSRFYTDKTVVAAKQRSIEYFSAAGHPALISAYFHHTIEEAKKLNASILYDPSSFSNKILKKHPFHWMRFYKND